LPIIYTCRHCGQKVGQLDKKDVDASMLGIHKLSEKDLKDMLLSKQNGDLHIQTICESCESALEAHPHYHELDHFIH